MPARTPEAVLAGEAALLLPAAATSAGRAGACLHRFFEGRADAEPGGTALVDGQTRVSYQELERRANRLAHRLREIGAGPEIRVAVCLERTSELVVALLAILKAGAAYVPIDPAYPRERQAILLADSRPAILVSEEHLLERIPAVAATVCVDRDRAELARRSDARLAATAVPSNLAYLIYTSGSTGRPKAIAIEHRSAVARLRWAARMFPRDELAGVLGSTSVCFDMSVFEVFATLALGGTLILAENALALPSLPAAAEVTLLNTVPSAAAELARNGGIPPSVRVVNLGGEPLRAVLVERLYALGHIEKIYNLYGPSEDTTYSTWALMRSGDPLPPAIGVTLDGTRGYLLDREMRQVGSEEEGELYLGGAGLSRGYLDRPELTAQRFVPNPHPEIPGERIYATGDLVRFRPSGEMDCLGRIDFQVKIRGFRVELGEVEAALDRAPGVADAAVVARELESRADVAEKVLVAYVVAAPGASLDIAALRAHLQASLTDAMVPAHFVVLPELPLSPNGKVDRKALPEPDLTAVPESHVPWRTPVEEVLAGIWSDIFGRPVGRDDNFFDLGGHSLLVARVVARVREALGVELTMDRLFELPTVAELAESLAAALGAGEALAAPRIEPVPRDAPLPLSYAQRRLWFLDQLASDSPVHNLPFRLRLTGDLDPAALERAFGEMARRHEALRTSFPRLRGEPHQAIAPAGPFLLPVVDLEGLVEAGKHREAAALAAGEADRLFDLGTGPVFRTVLLRLERRRHDLLLTMHHIVSDGWSMDLLPQELMALYKAFAAGRPSPLPDLPVQYADFAVWQREWLSGETLDRQLGYWRRRLAAAPEGLDLPADFPRPAVRRFHGANRWATLTGELSDALRVRCRREGVTLFMLLLAGFDALLARYSGQDDLLVCSPVANRSRAETEEMIGFFVNTLVLRADLAAAASFRGLLHQVRETALGAYSHQDLPFEMLVEELRPGRDLSRPPFSQVMLVLEYVREPLSGGGVRLELAEGTTATAKLDLTLFVVDGEPALRTRVEYDTDLYEAATVCRLLGHFERLLGAAVAEPERSWHDLPLLSAGEREQLLAGFSDSGSAAGPELCLHELFEAQVRTGPERQALVAAEGVRLSYGELNERAEQLARRLRSLGLGPEVLAGVLLDRTADLIVALLAVLKAGGAYAPLDPNYPQQRVLLMLETAKAAVLVTRRRLAEAFETALPSGLRTVYLDPGWEAEPAGESVGRPAVLPDNLAYVIFTSGSTGVPKGVAIQHRSAVAMIRWARDLYAPEEYAGMLGSTSICFDMSVFEIFATLAEGGKLVLAENALALPELAAREEVVLVDTVPSAMAELLRGGSLPSSIRTVNLGGEPLKGALVDEIYARLPHVERVINLYGPSEDTTFSTYSVVPRGAAHPLIGRPVAGESAWVLDGEMRPAPVGIPGALYLGGEGVTRGYLHRPELTAERYVPNPYGPPGSRLYQVGDLVRVLPSGELDFLGRLDHQVKVRGFRVELGEIESALARHPKVREAAVLAEPEPDGAGIRLIAYVEADDAAVGLAGELRSFLKQSLADYMVPAQLVRLDALPLTPNGKIDRRALAAMPQHSESAAAEADRAPRGYAEEILAGIWSEIFGQAVGVRENFFDLGGHSLLATRVMSRVREAFGIELPMRRLFERPTIAELAASVEAALGMGGALEAPRIAPVPRGGPLPLSFAQRRLWFLDRLSPGSAVYNIPYPLSLAGELDTGALAAALGEVVRRHEVLRTTFPSLDGEPYQAIEPAGDFPFPVVDLQGLEEPERSREAAALLAQDSVRPFDLAAGPLFRAALLRVDPERHVLLLAMHHIVADGWSMEVLQKELSALYDAGVEGRPSPLPELPVQYADFAAWQRQWLSGQALARQLEYWRRQLAGAPSALELPADRPRPAEQSLRGANLASTLPPDRAAGLRAFCRREGVTVFMMALAALDVLLLRYTHQEDLVAGSVVANRNHAETESLIGFFVNTLVLRTDLAGDPAFGILLRRVRETALAAYAHQDLPFETLVEELHPERDRSLAPVFQILLNHLQLGAPGLELAQGLRAEPLPVDTGTSKFDLSLTVVDCQESLELSVEFATDLFDAATVARLLDHLACLLTAAAAHPDLALSTLPLLRAEQAAQLLVAWNDAERCFGHRGRVHEQVAEQARRRPEALAVAVGGRRLSYGELEARANRLAHHLRARGVELETRVAVFMEPSPERVVGILAVLKAGGAYVSLDPSHPRERLAFQIADAASPVVLTQGNLAARLPELGAEALVLDGDWSGIEGCEDAAPDLRVEPGNLAYVIYTSGSAGTPKGVEVPHAGLENLVSWHRELYAVQEADRATLVANPAFDAAVWEVWPYLTAGASLHVPEPEVRLSPSALSRWWAETGVTLSFLPTPLTKAVLEEELPPGLVLRALIVGGDRLRCGPVPEAGFLLVNHYGPSEASVVSTVERVAEAGNPPIGRPIANTRVYVLGPNGGPVPLGVPGELCVAGAGLARGYLARPELTAERFVPDPFAILPGERMYRTGDRVRWRPEGKLDFLGRLDHQVKVRGLRIELGEIEAVLLRLPQVREAVVMTREEPPGNLRLVAYIVPAGEETPAGGELRRDLLVSLPEYMVPSAFVVLPSLPLTANGKIDRRALAAMPLPAATAADGNRAPRSYAEEVLAGIWSEIIGGTVGVRESFFDLGGHSLLAARVAFRIRSAFDVELPLQQIFVTPTVEGLAAWIEREIEIRRGVALPAIGLASHDGELPLSFGQQRLWLLDRLEPGTATFNLPAPLRLDGPLNAGALAGALAGIVERHQSLRTRFGEREGRGYQVVLPAGPLSLPVIDLSGLAAEPRQAEARRWVDEEARLPFDLTRGPLLRTTLLRLAAEEHVLLVTMHHIVTDGWSTAVFARELAALYEAAVTGGPSPLAELPLQYPDFAIWQRQALDGGTVAALLARWKERFGTVLPVLRLPTNRPRPAVPTNPGGYRSAVFPPELTESVRRLARASGTTLFMTLVAAFQALLARYSGQETVAVGSPVAGRDRAELEGLIGFFANTLVLPADLSGDPAFSEILQRVRDMALAAYDCQALPFEKLVEELQPLRDRGRSPLFQVMFLLQNAGEAAGGTAAGLTLSPITAINGTSQFDLTLAITETPRELSAIVEYNRDLFDGATIERLLEHYGRLLAAAVAEPETRLSALPPAAEELPRPAPEPALAAPPPEADTDARRDRLAARLSKLPQAQREALERRLRGGGAV